MGMIRTNGRCKCSIVIKRMARGWQQRIDPGLGWNLPRQCTSERKYQQKREQTEQTTGRVVSPEIKSTTSRCSTHLHSLAVRQQPQAPATALSTDRLGREYDSA
jgi:hypothetical protein